MRNWLRRLQIKGFVTGVLVTILLSGTLLVAGQTVTREITYGVSIVLNGQAMQLVADSQPFIMDGRTFLPVRAIAEAVNMPVDFDANTNTVFLGDRNQRTRTSLNIAAPFFDSGWDGGFAHNVNVRNVDSVSMGGITFSNASIYSGGRIAWASGTIYSLHNLNGQYRQLTGYVGRVDGSAMQNATMNIIGDGRVLATHHLTAQDLPTAVSVFVEGIRQLRIEFIFPSADRIEYSFSGFVE